MTHGEGLLMTPEEWAHEAVMDFPANPATWHWSDLEARVAMRIRAAIAEEREACAAIMCGWCRPWKRAPILHRLAAVGQAVFTHGVWSHLLTYEGGETAWVDCGAAEIRARR